MAQQSSRLNRLLTLLDTGSTQSTRFAAARQIGDIAKSHPRDLTSLLKKVAQYLRSKNWDTRVAAAHAIGAIAQNVKHTSVNDLYAAVEMKMSETGIDGSLGNILAWPNQSKFVSSISFQSFDLNKVLDFGALLASRGQEYDISADNLKSPRERLARQKQSLRRRLGLDVCEQFMDVNDMIKDEDLMVQKLHPHGNGLDHKIYASASVHNIQRLVAKMVPCVKRPSARELNLLKRKAKSTSKDQGKVWSEDSNTDVSNAHNTTAPKGTGPELTVINKVDCSLDDDADHDGEGVWPFRNFVEQLILDMFDPVWEIRHGSVMALREILAHHGASAGVLLPNSGSAVMPCELRDEGSICSSEDKNHTSTLKRDRSIDLNMQISADDSEPEIKRPKIEVAASPSQNAVLPASTAENMDITVEVEDVQCNLLDVQPDGGTIKLDAESYLDDVSCSHKEEAGEADLRSDSNAKCLLMAPDILKHLPEGSELVNLVEVARHSWLRNCEFLQDCAIRFLCVLSLDRFGDYVSDQVVAPVRETCAQALGAAFKYMHPLLVNDTLRILLQMQHRPEWEIRHGSLLGIKYLIAVRRDMLHGLLGAVLPACKAGLEDPDDDVRAVAADALIPAASSIVDLNGPTLHEIVMLLWDILLDLDDLSPSTSSVMNLLAEIYSQESMIPKMLGTSVLKEKQDMDLNDMVSADSFGERKDTQENPYMLSTLAPRLWPFMRHTITSVRLSAIRTLERLLDAGFKRSISQSSRCSFWPSFILGDTIRIVFQNLLLETNDVILESSERVWRLLAQVLNLMRCRTFLEYIFFFDYLFRDNR